MYCSTYSVSYPVLMAKACASPSASMGLLGFLQPPPSSWPGVGLVGEKTATVALPILVSLESHPCLHHVIGDGVKIW